MKRPAPILCNDGELHAVAVEIRFVRCGSARCSRCTGNRKGHGPYAYAVYYAAGKTRRDYIGKTNGGNPCFA